MLPVPPCLFLWNPMVSYLLLSTSFPHFSPSPLTVFYCLIMHVEKPASALPSSQILIHGSRSILKTPHSREKVWVKGLAEGQ